MMRTCGGPALLWHAARWAQSLEEGFAFLLQQYVLDCGRIVFERQNAK